MRMSSYIKRTQTCYNHSPSITKVLVSNTFHKLTYFVSFLSGEKRMAVRGKMEVEVDLKSSADQFYSIIRNTPHHLPNVCNDLHDAEVHEGEWVSHGSIRKWTYSADKDKKETFKEKVEFDDENKRVTHIGIEGDVFNYYKSYKAIWEAAARDGGPAVAKMIIEYEKLNESMPHPVHYLDFMANVTKDIDAHLVKA